MNCPTETTLQAYLNGQLADEERDALKEHIEGCERCGHILAGLSAADSSSGAPAGLAGPGEVADIDPELEREIAARYAVIEKLGSGAFGTVFRARDMVLDRDVAVKVLNCDRLASPQAIHRFCQEIKIASRVEAKGIVRVYDADPRARYFVMEYMSGGSLRKVIEDNPRGLGLIEACRIMCGVAKAVEYLHTKGAKRSRSALVHGDLKPENILLDGDRTPHIADFGLAYIADEMIAQGGWTGGTYDYMSPEQARRKLRGSGTVDELSDVWAIGVMLFELLTGQLPHGKVPRDRDFSSREEYQQALEDFLDRLQNPHNPCRNPRGLNPSILQPLNEIVRGCLEKDPGSRTPAASTVAKSLEAWLEAAALLPAVHDFGGYRGEKHRHFSDRPWLRDEVLAWFVHANERALLITGNWGTGKTAFLTDLVQRNPEHRILAYHFCQFDTPETLRPSFFLRNLAAMLRDRLPGYSAALEDVAVAHALAKENCEEDPASAFEFGILEPLHRLSPPGKGAYYIVVDGLDEALLWKGQGASIVDLLSTRAERLPSWLRLVLSSRPQPEIRSRFSNITSLAIDPEVSDAVDEDRAAEIRADAERHIHERLQEPNSAEWLQHNGKGVSQAAAEILDKSEANFLYVRMLFDDLERHGSRGSFNLDDLPRGLNGLFHGFFKRHFPNRQTQDFTAARKVLEVVRAAYEPPDEVLLAGATGLNPDGELPELLEKLSDFLRSRKDAPAVDRYEEDRYKDEEEEVPGEQEQSREEARAVDRYSFVNDAITQWLTDGKRAREYHANPKRGHEQLAQFFWARYEEEPHDLPDYSVRYLARHLRESGDWKRLTRLLLDLRYLEAKADRGLVFELAAEFRDALEIVTPRCEKRKHLQLIEQALRRDIQFIHRYPATLFSCLWNTCWWYDSDDAKGYYDPPDSGWPPNGPPWDTPRENKVSPLLEKWRMERESREQEFTWVASLQPPPYPLGMGELAMISDQGWWWHRPDLPEYNDLAMACDFPGVVVARGVVLVMHERHLLSGDWDGLLHLSNDLATLGTEGTTRDVSRGGRSVAVGYDDGEIVIWKSDGSRRNVDLRKLSANHDASISRLCFSQDGTRLLSAASDGTLLLWDVKSQQILSGPISAHGDTVKALALSPDGRHAASAGRCRGTARNFEVSIWDLARHERVCAIHLPENPTYDRNEVNQLAFFPNGEFLVGGLDDGTVRVWHVQSGNQYASLQGHLGTVLAVDISPNGDRILSGSSDGTVRIWQFDRLDEYARRSASPQCLRTPDRCIYEVGFSSTGQFVMTYDGGTAVRIWNPKECCEAPRLKGARPVVQKGVVALDVKQLDASMSNPVSAARRWARPPAGVKRNEARLSNPIFSPDGKHLVSVANPGGNVLVWDGFNGTLRHVLPADALSSASVVIMPDSLHAVTGSRDGVLRVWDLSSGRLTRLLNDRNRQQYLAILSLACDRDGRRLVSADEDGVVRLWDLDGDGEPRRFMGHERAVYSVAISASGHHIASGSLDGTLRLWDSQTHTQVSCIARERAKPLETVFPYHEEEPFLNVSFSPDDRFLVGTASHRIWIVDTTTGQLISTLGGPEQLWCHVNVVKFSSDGTHLITTGGVHLDTTETFTHDDFVERIVWHPWVFTIDLQSEMVVQIDQGYGDVSAIAAGAARFPWQALVRRDETVIESLVDGSHSIHSTLWATDPPIKEWISSKMTRFPVPFEFVATHPCGRIWAGVLGGDLYLIELKTRD